MTSPLPNFYCWHVLGFSATCQPNMVCITASKEFDFQGKCVFCFFVFCLYAACLGLADFSACTPHTGDHNALQDMTLNRNEWRWMDGWKTIKIPHRETFIILELKHFACFFCFTFFFCCCCQGQPS